jgi:hypothetical protein
LLQGRHPPAFFLPGGDIQPVFALTAPQAFAIDRAYQRGGNFRADCFLFPDFRQKASSTQEQ